MQLFLFCVVVGLAASAVAIIEILAYTQDHYEAVRTKEVQALYMVNVALAGVLAYVLVSIAGGFSIGLLSALAIILGYPLLLHTKFFNFKDTSWGFEELYQRVGNMLIPGIDDSIDERGITYLAEFQNHLSTEQLVPHTKAYLRIKLQKGDVPTERANELLALMDRLLEESEANPGRTGENNALIFETLYRMGNYRAVRHIRKAATRAAA